MRRRELGEREKRVGSGFLSIDSWVFDGERDMLGIKQIDEGKLREGRIVVRGGQLSCPCEHQRIHGSQ